MAQRPADKTGAGASAEREGRDLADDGGRDAAAEEARRLRTLREYHLLDTAPEPGFDRVTKLLADLFDVPIALVSLIDESRQWFKSAHGFARPETPRDIGFCHYAIATGNPLVVPDAAADPRLRANPPRSEEGRRGKEGGSTGRNRGSPDH